jgi:hypothetical protein
MEQFLHSSRAQFLADDDPIPDLVPDGPIEEIECPASPPPPMFRPAGDPVPETATFQTLLGNAATQSNKKLGQTAVLDLTPTESISKSA